MENRVLLTPVKVEEIWAKLLMCYGQEWLMRWRGIEVDFVKAQMAETLGELSDHQIAWALDHLPERAPSLPAFMRIAECAPAPKAATAAPGGMEWVWAPAVMWNGYLARARELRPAGSGLPLAPSEPVEGETDARAARIFDTDGARDDYLKELRKMGKGKVTHITTEQRHTQAAERQVEQVRHVAEALPW